MMELRYTLVSDGSSDRMLIPVLNWLLREHFSSVLPIAQWADIRNQSAPKDLTGRLVHALAIYPCDLLVIHRDTEKEPLAHRETEIRTAFGKLNRTLPTLLVIPVKMQEAWFLFDEKAIRFAAANPNGRVKLTLPSLKRVEDLPDPKQILYELLEKASELTGRRLQKFETSRRVHALADSIEDFAPLRALSAFNHLESQVKKLNFRL